MDPQATKITKKAMRPSACDGEIAGDAEFPPSCPVVGAGESPVATAADLVGASDCEDVVGPAESGESDA